MTAHTLIAHVEDKPGVLNRISSLVRRRGYNITSLTVGRTAEPGISRLTLVFDADAHIARLIEAQLYKLVNVLLVEDVTHTPAIARELALIKLRADAASRARILQVCEVFGARILDLTAERITIELASTPDKIDDLAGVLASEGPLEMVRTGVVAMPRGAPHAFTPRAERATSTSETPTQGTQPWPESSTTATPISA